MSRASPLSISTPRVSVLLSVYNGERYLAQAIDSILGQTFSDWECVIVDDCSTDGTAAILNGYRDPRLKGLHNPHNLGLAAALNRGLAETCGEYIARMDADDIAHPERLARQVQALDAMPVVGVLGGAADLIAPTGDHLGHLEMPTDPAMIVWRLLFYPALIHPTVMMRRALLMQVGGYDATSRAEDFDLWARLIDQTRFANLSDVLISYRQHPDALTVRHLDRIKAHSWPIRRRLFAQLVGNDPGDALITQLDQSQIAQQRLRSGFTESQLDALNGLLIAAYWAMVTRGWIVHRSDSPAYADLLGRIRQASRYSPAVVTPTELARHWQPPARRAALKLIRKAAKLIGCWPEAWQ